LFRSPAGGYGKIPLENETAVELEWEGTLLTDSRGAQYPFSAPDVAFSALPLQSACIYP
jgi:hypothetical protein